MPPNYEQGECLYHYTTREAAFVHILPSNELRFSPYDEMRDPLENKKFLFAGRYSVPDGLTDDDPAHPEVAAKDLDMHANRIRATAKLLSFTVDADDFERRARLFARGWARARMWEQYAENHAGVCLVFDRRALIDRVVEALTTLGLASPYHRKVEYTQDGLGGGLPVNFDELAGNVDERFTQQFVEDHHDKLFFLKTSDWSTEYEYRFVVTAPDTRYVKVNFGTTLRAVVVGESFPDWQRPAAVEACRAGNLGLLRLEWSTGRPRAWWLDEPPD